MMTSTLTREARFLIWLTIAVIAPFGLLLVLYPRGAGDYWAWEIAQPRTAVLVGAIYFASALYYLLLSTRRRWLPIQSSLRSLVVVAAWLLVAAMFHWEDFFPYRTMTLLWLVTYYLPLLAFPILDRLQAEHGGNTERVEGRTLARGWRAWLILRAAVYGPVAILLFVLAPQASALWPWPIEPVNLRMFSGQIALFGAYLAFAMGDGFWPRIRLFMILTAGLAAVHLVGMIVGGTAYDGSSPVGVFLPLIFAEWLATSLALLWTYRR